MHSCRYTNCDHSYGNFQGGIQDFSALQSSHMPDYWTTQRFEVPSAELYSYFGPNGGYQCANYSNLPYYESSLDNGPNTQDQMELGSQLNYLSGSGREYDSDALYQSEYYNVQEREPSAMQGASYCFKPKLCSSNFRDWLDMRGLRAWQSMEMRRDSQADICPVADQACYDCLADHDSLIANESQFSPDLQSTNIIDAGYEHYADFLMEKWSSDEEVDDLERGTNYKLYDQIHKARYLCDGKNMIKLGSNKYAKTVGSMGKILKKTLKKKFKEMVPIPRQSSRDLYDCPEE